MRAKRKGRNIFSNLIWVSAKDGNVHRFDGVKSKSISYAVSLKTATRQLSDLIGKHLKKISPQEQRKKTERAYKELLARIGNKKNMPSG